MTIEYNLQLSQFVGNCKSRILVYDCGSQNQGWNEGIIYRQSEEFFFSLSKYMHVSSCVAN